MAAESDDHRLDFAYQTSALSSQAYLSSPLQVLARADPPITPNPVPDSPSRRSGSSSSLSPPPPSSPSLSSGYEDMGTTLSTNPGHPYEYNEFMAESFKTDDVAEGQKIIADAENDEEISPTSGYFGDTEQESEENSDKISGEMDDSDSTVVGEKSRNIKHWEVADSEADTESIKEAEPDIHPDWMTPHKIQHKINIQKEKEDMIAAARDQKRLKDKYPMLDGTHILVLAEIERLQQEYAADPRAAQVVHAACRKYIKLGDSWLELTRFKFKRRPKGKKNEIEEFCYFPLKELLPPVLTWASRYPDLLIKDEQGHILGQETYEPKPARMSPEEIEALRKTRPEVFGPEASLSEQIPDPSVSGGRYGDLLLTSSSSAPSLITVSEFDGSVRPPGRKPKPMPKPKIKTKLGILSSLRDSESYVQKG